MSASPAAGLVYLDYAATAPMRPEARRALDEALDGAWGNPSSLHRAGRAARAALEEARARLAALVGADPRALVFTRGGTEADNLALKGVANAAGAGAVLVSAVEHPAIHAAAEALRGQGREVRVVPVTGDGVIDLDALERALDDRVALVSVMWANNETGVLQPIRAVAEACARRGVPLHSDAVQALGKVEVRAGPESASLLSLSAHKVGGPRGMGALIVPPGTPLAPLHHGGGQEGGRRPGTEDVAGAISFAAAADAAEGERTAEVRRLGELRDHLEAGLRAAIEGVVVHGAAARRLPTISSISVPGADPELMLAMLDLEGIAVSSGSACSSGSVEPSRVLLAMGVAPRVAGPSLRFSMGPGTELSHIERVIGVLPAIVGRLRGA